MENLINGLNKIKITENLIIGLNKITITDSEETSDKDKLNIIELFRKNIKDKKIELEKYNNKHCGKEGYWLEKQMNIKHNSQNEPDIHGYEMKKDSKKITFGDFSASEYLFSKDKKYINDTNKWDADLVNITKDQFIKFFGTQKILKNNRYSWSGSCIPTYNNWNTCGQKLTVTYENTYNKICFGKKFDYECFIDGIKNKIVFFDSGMYIGNNRNYSQFRSCTGNFWDTLIIEEYT